MIIANFDIDLIKLLNVFRWLNLFLYLGVNNFSFTAITIRINLFFDLLVVLRRSSFSSLSRKYRDNRTFNFNFLNVMILWKYFTFLILAGGIELRILSFWINIKVVFDFGFWIKNRLFWFLLSVYDRCHFSFVIKNELLFLSFRIIRIGRLIVLLLWRNNSWNERKSVVNRLDMTDLR